jgi:uncharacterized Zn finger protein (UPF0148 family)
MKTITTNICPGCNQELVTLGGAPYCLICGDFYKVEVPKVEAKPAKVRCPHVATIREFARVAREAGLSMADKDRARGAMGVYLGKRIASRSELTANDWENGITAVKAGVLFW